MNSEFILRLLSSAAAVLLIDTLLYFGLRRLFAKPGVKSPARKRYNWIYLTICVAFVLYVSLHYLYLQLYGYGSGAYRQYFFISGAFLLIYAPKLVMLLFILTGNFILFLAQLLSFIFQGRDHYDFVRRTRRIKLLSWVGFICGWLFFGYVLYGMLYTRTDFQVKEVSVSYRNLPAGFDGVRILLFADLHTGSFFNDQELHPALLKMRELNPDIILFSGDMINVSAQETKPYIQLFSAMNPPLGKFAVLGNHDEDDYMKLTPTEGREVIERNLVQAEQQMGFLVLRNEHKFIHRAKDSLAVIGIDSWGEPPFHKYGNLKDATKGVPSTSFKILLSHVPSHWQEEVRGKTNIDLTLAGHTHAAQFGIDEPWCQWSPISLKYPLYMGLYQWGNQYLYVNAGLGYLGFPGRIGIPPEITMITLNRN